MDEGMSQGPARLFYSTNQGLTWSTLQNTKDGTTISYEFSGDGQTIYGLVSNPAGGLTYSTDDGLHWTPERALGNDGGAPESISNFGPKSAIYQILGGPMYVTHNSVTWRILPELPAGTYMGLHICTDSSVGVSRRTVKSGGLTYTYVDFTNHGLAACYLDGAPDVQPLNEQGANVGQPNAVELGSIQGNFVVLKANGGVANIVLDNNVPSHPSVRSCAGEIASSLQLDFNSPSVFKLPLPGQPMTVCTVYPSLYFSSISGGKGAAAKY
jgi:hypothetical protein